MMLAMPSSGPPSTAWLLSGFRIVGRTTRKRTQDFASSSRPYTVCPSLQDYGQKRTKKTSWNWDTPRVRCIPVSSSTSTKNPGR